VNGRAEREQLLVQIIGEPASEREEGDTQSGPEKDRGADDVDGLDEEISAHENVSPLAARL
jgi:hypothetical protein